MCVPGFPPRLVPLGNRPAAAAAAAACRLVGVRRAAAAFRLADASADARRVAAVFRLADARRPAAWFRQVATCPFFAHPRSDVRGA